MTKGIRPICSKSLFLGGDLGDEVRKSLGQLLGVGKVDAFVDCVSIGLGSNKTEGHNEGVGVHLVELSEEGNGATHSVGSGIHAVEEVLA